MWQWVRQAPPLVVQQTGGSATQAGPGNSKHVAWPPEVAMVSLWYRALLGVAEGVVAGCVTFLSPCGLHSQLLHPCHAVLRRSERVWAGCWPGAPSGLVNACAGWDLHPWVWPAPAALGQWGPWWAWGRSQVGATPHRVFGLPALRPTASVTCPGWLSQAGGRDNDCVCVIQCVHVRVRC